MLRATQSRLRFFSICEWLLSNLFHLQKGSSAASSRRPALCFLFSLGIPLRVFIRMPFSVPNGSCYFPQWNPDQATLYFFQLSKGSTTTHFWRLVPRVCACSKCHRNFIKNIRKFIASIPQRLAVDTIWIRFRYYCRSAAKMTQSYSNYTLETSAAYLGKYFADCQKHVATLKLRCSLREKPLCAAKMVLRREDQKSCRLKNVLLIVEINLHLTSKTAWGSSKK